MMDPKIEQHICQIAKLKHGLSGVPPCGTKEVARRSIPKTPLFERTENEAGDLGTSL